MNAALPVQESLNIGVQFAIHLVHGLLEMNAASTLNSSGGLMSNAHPSAEGFLGVDCCITFPTQSYPKKLQVAPDQPALRFLPR